MLLRCVSRPQKEGENIIVLIVGDHVAMTNQFMMNCCYEPASVHFTGKVENIADYLLNADGFVLSSAFEGLPIALLEVLSAGGILYARQ